METKAPGVTVVDLVTPRRHELLVEFKERPIAMSFRLGCFPKDGAIPPDLPIPSDWHQSIVDLAEIAFILFLTEDAWKAVQEEPRPEGKSLLALVAEKAEHAYESTDRNLKVWQITQGDEHGMWIGGVSEKICDNPLTGRMVDMRYGKMFDFTHVFL